MSIERKDHKKIKESFAILKTRGIKVTQANAIIVYDELVAKEQVINEIKNRIKVESAKGVHYCVSNEEVAMLLKELHSAKG
jgi:siroheme synthase